MNGILKSQLEDFTNSDMLTILEIARIVLTDETYRESILDRMDIADDEADNIKSKILEIM